jgi:hypothetical protein
LLDYLDGLAMEPTFVDLRVAHLAHRRAGNRERAVAILDRLLAVPVVDGDGWYARVQLLTEAGQLEQASTLLAEIARGERPDALDSRLVRGQPSQRISRARDRLVRAQRRETG